MIHLDTSYLIRALEPGSAEDLGLRRWLRSGELLAVSAVAWGEFLCGPTRTSEQELAARIVPERLAFTDVEAATAAELFNTTGRRRGTFVDCMIAATALRAGAALATSNARDFRHFEAAGLKLTG